MAAALTHEEAFRADVRGRPGDDAPRLIYADWLDEHGGPAGAARAELIRCQVARAALTPDDPRARALAGREADLLRGHEGAWVEGDYAGALAAEGDLRAEALRLRAELVGLPADHPRRAELWRSLQAHNDRLRGPLGPHRRRSLAPERWQLLVRQSGVPDCGPLGRPFLQYTFARGFIETAVVDAETFVYGAAALLRFTCLRHLTVADPGDQGESRTSGLGDEVVAALASGLARYPTHLLALRLESLVLREPRSAEVLAAACPGAVVVPQDGPGGAAGEDPIPGLG
jgi:uncharacterized protein (TIGR02996 family)